MLHGSGGLQTSVDARKVFIGDRLEPLPGHNEMEGALVISADSRGESL